MLPSRSLVSLNLPFLKIRRSWRVKHGGGRSPNVDLQIRQAPASSRIPGARPRGVALLLTIIGLLVIIALVQYFQFKAPSVPRVSPVAHQVNETAVALECTVPKEPPRMESTISSLVSIVHDEDRLSPASSVYSKSGSEISLVDEMGPGLFPSSCNEVSVAGSSRSRSYEYTLRSFSYPPVVTSTLTIDWLYGSMMFISRPRQDGKGLYYTIPSISSYIAARECGVALRHRNNIPDELPDHQSNINFVLLRLWFWC